MNKCLVTGGAGFIGSHLIAKLLEMGFSVICLDVREPKFSHKNLDVFVGNFNDKNLLDSILPSCNTVYHLASTTIPKSSNENMVYDLETNLISTISLLDSSVFHNIKDFIFASSGGTVYGIPKTLPVEETSLTSPLCSYGIVKLCIEKYLNLYSRLYNLNTCSLRIANPYGKNQTENSAVGAVSLFCQKAICNEQIEVWGDGSVVRDYIYIDDVVSALISVLNLNKTALPINIGSGIGHSINQILNTIRTVSEKHLNIKYTASRGFDVPEIFLDITNAKTILGWKPKVSLDQGISMMLSPESF